MIAYPGESLADVISSGYGAELISIPDGSTVARTGEASSSSDFEDGHMFEKVSYNGRTLWVDRAQLDAAASAGTIKVPSVQPGEGNNLLWLAVALLLGLVFS